MSDLLDLLSDVREGGPVETPRTESEIDTPSSSLGRDIGGMPTDIPPAVVETIFRLLWKNLPHESWSAKEEVEAWWNLAFVDKAALKLMKGFPLHLRFLEALTDEQAKWLRGTNTKAEAVELSANESPSSFLSDDEDKCERIFMSKSSSTLRSLGSFPLSPNFNNTAHHQEHCQSCRGANFFPAHGTLTDEDEDCHFEVGSRNCNGASLQVPELLTFPECLSTLSLSVVNTGGSPTESRCSALHLQSTFARSPQLETLSVSARCLFTDLSFDAGSLPNLKQLHLHGVNIPDALLRSLPLLESASWNAVMLRNSDAHPAGSGESLPPSSGWDSLALSLSASDDEPEFFTAPVGAFNLSAWCAKARELTVTTVADGAGECRTRGLAGLPYPTPELLEDIVRSPCETLTLKFHEHKGVQGCYLGEVAGWQEWHCALRSSLAIDAAFVVDGPLHVMLELSSFEIVDTTEIVLKRRPAWA